MKRPPSRLAAPAQGRGRPEEPAVSRQGQTLEHCFGLPLFVRHPCKDLMRTPKGEMLVPRRRLPF